MLPFTEYYNEEGTTFELCLVGKIKQQLSADPTLRPEYPSSLGLAEFTRQATEVSLGKRSRAIVENRVISPVHTTDCNSLQQQHTTLTVYIVAPDFAHYQTHRSEAVACSFKQIRQATVYSHYLEGF